MHVAKVVGAIVGLVLLTMVVVVGIGLLGQSRIGFIVLSVVLLLVGAVTWGRRMDAIASNSAFLRRFDSGATQAHDRLLQDDDAMRERQSTQHQRHHPDLE